MVSYRSLLFFVIVVVNAIQSNALLQIKQSEDIVKIILFYFQFVHQCFYIRQ